MNLLMKVLGVLLLATGVAYYLVPLLRHSTATTLDAAPAGTAGADTNQPSRGLPMPRRAGVVESIATVESAGKVSLRARAGGVVDTLNVRAGDKVEPGQVIVGLDQGDLRFAIESATNAVTDAEERVRRTAFELAQTKAKLEQAVATARDAEAEANERKDQAELESRHGMAKADQGVRDAEAALAMAVQRGERALHGFNRTRGLAGLEPVPSSVLTSEKPSLPPMPAKFDDTLVKLADYSDQELAVRESLLAIATAKEGIAKAQTARQQFSESSVFAVQLATSRAARANRERKVAESNLEAHTQSAQFATAQAEAALRSAKLGLEQAQWALSKSQIKAPDSVSGALLAELSVSLGSHVSGGQEVAVLLDPGHLKIRCTIPVDIMPLFARMRQKGDDKISVRVESTAFASSLTALGLDAAPIYRGRLVRASGVVSPTTMAQTAEVELERLPVNVSKKDLAETLSLQPGMVVRVVFESASTEGGE